MKRREAALSGEMWHFDDDMTTGFTGTAAVAGGLQKAARRLVATVCLLAVSATAVAQVVLGNSVYKVERYADATGTQQTRLGDAGSVLPGDELLYTITFTNTGAESVAAGSIVITNAIPARTEYLDGTASGSGTDIVFSVDGENFAEPAALSLTRDGVTTPAAAKDYRSIRWVYRAGLQPGEAGEVSFNVRMQ